MMYLSRFLCRLSIDLPRPTSSFEVPFFLDLLLGVGGPEDGAFFSFLILQVHDCWAENCIGLFSNAVLLLFSNSKLVIYSQYHLIPCDSSPLLLFQFSVALRQIFVIEAIDLYFSSPSSSTSDNQA